MTLPATQLPRLLFVHIPKSAGISLYKAFLSVYKQENALRFADITTENKNLYLTMNHEEVRRYPFITGHLTLPFFLSKQIEDYHVITVVRDPVDRELSAYFYIKSWKDHPLHDTVKKMDLYDYCEMLEKQTYKNLQCWFLSEKCFFEPAKEVLDQKVFMAAPLDKLDLFTSALRQKLNLPPFHVTRSNETSFKMGAHELHPDIINRIREASSEDVKLYNYIKHKFETEVVPTINPEIKSHTR